MTDIWFVSPPEPPEGQVWCLHCLMQAKDSITEAHHDEIQKLLKDGKKAVHWIPWDTRILLQPAIAKGLSSVPQLGIVDLCSATWPRSASSSPGCCGPARYQVACCEVKGNADTRTV